MSLSFRSIDECPADHWDALVRKSPDGWVFGLHGWQKLVTAVDDWGFVEHGFSVYEDGQLQAVVPLHVQSASRVAGSSGWGGCGPVIRGGLAPTARRRLFYQAVARMIEIAKDEGAIRLDVSSSPVTRSSIRDPWAVNVYAVRGFDDGTLTSQVLSLSGSETDLWQSLSKTARHCIRRAEKAGLRVEPIDWLSSLESYYDIHVETYRRTGVQPHPRRYFEGIARSIAPSGHARLLALLSPGGEPIAFHNTAALGIGTYYHTGCSRTALKSLSPGYLLMWEAIKAAKASGAEWYDIGWIFPETKDRKQRDLTHFKTRFGGEPRQAFRAKLDIAHPIAKAAAQDRLVEIEKPTRETLGLGMASRIARRARHLLTLGTPS